MDDGIEKTQECYNFPGIRDLFKKHKSPSAKSHHHHHHHKNNHVSSHNNKIKPSNEGQDEDIFKVNHEKKQNAYNHMNGVKKIMIKRNGVEELNKMNHRHDDDGHNNCFRAIILLSTSKKKQIQSKVSATDLPDYTTGTRQIEKIPSRSRSFDTTPSIGRSRSIDNSRRSENWGKAPNNSRVPSINRTTSTGSRTNSFNGRNINGSFVKRSTSIGRSTSDDVTSSLRKINVCRSGPIIMFSNSSGVLKPPAIEQHLECSLEELCYGCVKNIKVSRDVYSFTGQIIQQEEVLTVNVKPGWKTGTKITFQGSPKDEKPGEYPADVVFIITEKHHPWFRRNEDELELEIEIPLADALTGCTLTIPLLGREKMSLSIDDIVYPGFEKTLVGHGMPNQKKPHHRGDLKVKFLVEFPKSLTVEQQSEILTILSS